VRGRGLARAVVVPRLDGRDPGAPGHLAREGSATAPSARVRRHRNPKWPSGYWDCRQGRARRLDATHSPRRAVSTAPVARLLHWAGSAATTKAKTSQGASAIGWSRLWDSCGPCWARWRRGPTQREPAGSWPGSGAPVKSCGGSGVMGAIGDSWWHGGVNSGAASCVSRCVLQGPRAVGCCLAGGWATAPGRGSTRQVACATTMNGCPRAVRP
jgi:hypothetical protein